MQENVAGEQIPDVIQTGAKNNTSRIIYIIFLKIISVVALIEAQAGTG